MGNIIIPPVGVAGITPVEVLQLSFVATFNCSTNGWQAYGYTEGKATFDHLPEIVLIDCSDIYNKQSNTSPVLALGSTWASASEKAAYVAHEAYYWQSGVKAAKLSIVFSLKNVNGVGVVEAIPRIDEITGNVRTGSCGPSRCTITLASIRKSDFDAVLGK